MDGDGGRAARRRPAGIEEGRRVRAREVQVVGPRRADRRVRGDDAVADRDAPSRWSAPTQYALRDQGAGAARGSGLERRRLRRRSSTPIPATATSPARWSTSTTACPPTTSELKELGVDVKGKIVIARYGAGWRGIKPKVAYEHGAIGCLIYSDPRDDGYFAGDVYPAGPYRPEYGAQRGSVMDMPVHPGDPLTPGWGSEARRQEAGARGRGDDPEDSGAADLVRRRAADPAGAEGPGRAERMARRAAVHLSRRARARRRCT